MSTGPPRCPPTSWTPAPAAPPRDVAVELPLRAGPPGAAWTPLGGSATDADGRCKDLPALPEGTTHVRLRFEVEPYLTAQPRRSRTPARQRRVLPRGDGHLRRRRRASTTTYRCCSTRSATPYTEGASTDMTTVLGQNQYGKAETRVVRITRDGATHHIKDLNVSVALSGDMDEVHLLRVATPTCCRPTPPRTRCTPSPRSTASSPPSSSASTWPGTSSTSQRADPPGPDPDRGVRLGAHRAGRRQPGRRGGTPSSATARRPAPPRSPTTARTGRSSPGCKDLMVHELHRLGVLGLRQGHATPPSRRPTTGSWPPQVDRPLARTAGRGDGARRARLGRLATRRSARHLLEAFAETYSYSLQQTLYAMGTRVIEQPRRGGRGPALAAQQAPLPGRPGALRPEERQRGLLRRRPPVRPDRGHGAARRRRRRSSR